MDEELLWKAWPDGYLDMRGVSTVNYGICFGKGLWVEAESMASGPTVAVLPYEERFSENVQAGPEDTQACLEAGYFLPNVDPEKDPATWACLLRDLAKAAGFPEGASDGLTWGGDEWLGQWTLRNGDGDARQFPDIDTDDHREALVLARIQMRTLVL